MMDDDVPFDEGLAEPDLRSVPGERFVCESLGGRGGRRQETMWVLSHLGERMSLVAGAGLLCPEQALSRAAWNELVFARENEVKWRQLHLAKYDSASVKDERDGGAEEYEECDAAIDELLALLANL